MTTEQVIDQRPVGNNAIFQELDDYPWESDVEFQTGLVAILGPDPARERAEHLTLRARCFYYSRKSNVPVNFDAYKNWRSQHSSPSHSNDISTAAALSSNSHNETAALGGIPPATEAASTTEPPAPYPNSFSQIVELITTGQPIPGIKEVPDTLLSGQETQTTTARRKKPWEKDEAGSADRIVRTET